MGSFKFISMVTLRHSKGVSVTLSEDGYRKQKNIAEGGTARQSNNSIRLWSFLSCLSVYGVYLCHFVPFSLSYFQLFQSLGKYIHSKDARDSFRVLCLYRGVGMFTKFLVFG